MSQIDIFKRVFLMIKQHFTSTIPFRVEIAIRYYGLALPPFTKSRFFPGQLRVFQKRHKTLPIQLVAFGEGQSAPFTQCRIEIDEFNDRLNSNIRRSARNANYQRHPKRFMQRVMLSPEIVFPQQPSMVAPENYKSIFVSKSSD